MATSTRNRSSGPVSHYRSLSPSGRFCSSSMSSASSGFASSSSSFSSTRTGGFFQKSASPTNLFGSVTSSQSVRFSMDQRPTSPSRSIAVSPRNQVVKKSPSTTQKRTCMCSPTNHPGSFRCSLHKNAAAQNNQSSSCPSNRLNARRSAMTNSLVRIGTVEGGDWVKRALSALIRPSSHHQKRREGFQPRPSRLSVMSKAEDL